MSILFVVAPCNLFNSHLDVASQITGALSLPGSNPRTPLVCLRSRNEGRGLFFSFISFFFLTQRRCFSGTATAFAGDHLRLVARTGQRSERLVWQKIG